MRGGVMIAVVAACGSGIASRSPYAPVSGALVTASGDASAIRKLLRDEVMDGGLWFADPECVRQFPAPGMIHEDRLDAFAKCLATLQFKASTREDPFIDVEVLTYAPGIEVEALMIHDRRGMRLGWIGYSARRDLADALPTISADALEALRSTGDRNGPVDPAAMAAVGDEAYAWLKICLDAEGTVTKVHVRETSSLAAARVFTAAAQQWRFRPFTVGGKPLPACAMERIAYPVPAKPPHEVLPMPSPSGEEETVVMGAREMEKRRTGGEKHLVPDDRTKIAIRNRGIDRIVGAFKLCVDDTGRVTRVKPLRSTGFDGYDAQLIHAILQWRYQPYVDEGHAVAVCTAVTFIYTQN